MVAGLHFLVIPGLLGERRVGTIFSASLPTKFFLLMKQITTLLAACAFSVGASAQLTLSGTGYTQNFDGIGAGLPTGWMVHTASTATALGNMVSFTTTPTRWQGTAGGFRNMASADAFSLATYTTDSATQAAATDRALGLRQVGNTSSTFPGSDSGAAFVLQIANTSGLTAFNMSFKLQSLDTSSPRTTLWRVDYATGANPTSFTNANATGTLTTGNRAFSNNTINVNFGSALNNQTGPVWIRIVTLTTSTGTGNRPTTGIDDVSLSWTGNANSIGAVSGEKLPVSVLGQATTDRVIVGFTTTKAEALTVSMFDLNGRQVLRQTIDATAGANQVTLSPRGIAAGQYLIRVANASSFGTAKVVVE